MSSVIYHRSKCRGKPVRFL